MSDNRPDGEQCLLVRFEFFRNPGVKASCIGMVRDIDPFNWFKGEFYVASSMPGLQTVVERFALTEKTYAVQKLLFDGLANVDFLVVRSGERAAFSIRDAPLVDNIISSAVPLFDEHGILKAIEAESRLSNILVAPNTFGTWGDTSLHKLCSQVGVDFYWKRVGTNGDLLPLQSKAIVIKQSLELGAKGRSARKPTREFALEQ